VGATSEAGSPDYITVFLGVFVPQTCGVFFIICPFILVIVLSVLRSMASDYAFGLQTFLIYFLED
jgi:cytochrome c oxidase subunit IV